MNKTYRTEFRRKYLIEALPEPLTPASQHLQLFDNYITGTRMRIRTVRDPGTKEWSWILQQRLWTGERGSEHLRIGEIYLNEAEHTVFEPFEGNEIRKNRYFHEIGGRQLTFDIYLWPLWGLNVASVEFPDADSLASYEMPTIAVFDVTANPFFRDENLVEKKFEDIQAEVARMAGNEDPAERAVDTEVT